MKISSRILALAAALLLMGGFFLPVWQIDLAAPQYPEGLGMKIWIDKLSGDIDIINGLNHYIGMKHIKAEMFPEFGYMKYILGALVGIGVLTAALGKRPLLYTWVLLLVVTAAVGMYDFWRWEYDYGHNLDPTAAIIVPGMSYQPPLWGYKDLLNFRAGSFPDQGGWAIIVAGIMAVLAIATDLIRRKKTEKAPVAVAQRPLQAPVIGTRLAGSAFLLVLVTAAMLSSCSSGTQPIAYGKDGCEHCKMTIMDPRFGAEILNKQGKAYKFDSGECMIGFLKEGKIAQEKIGQLLVTDFNNSAQLIDVKQARFLHSEAIPSPMGANVSAYSSSSGLHQALQEKGGTAWTWDDFYRAAGGEVALEQ